MYLLVFSYSANLIIGGPVLFLHNLSDIFIAISRIISETHYNKILAGPFILSIIIWIYTRVYCFSTLIYEVIFKMDYFMTSPFLQVIFGGLLGSLQMLHLYWTYLLLKILYDYAKVGEAEDMLNNN